MAFSVVRPPSLAHIVDRIWDWDMPAQPFRLERVLPSAEAGLIVNLAEAGTRLYDTDGTCHHFDAMTLDGPRSASSIIDTAEQVRVMGVLFKPGMAAAFFRERMDRLLDRTTDLGDLVHATDSVRLRERLLAARDAASRLRVMSAWLHARRPDRAPPDADLLALALARLRDARRVDAIDGVAREAGISRRRLVRHFSEHVGLSPKRFLRLQRFRHVIERAHGAAQVDWAGLALDGGYADQAHLCHEFRAFSGMTPTDYLARQGPWSDHIALA